MIPGLIYSRLRFVIVYFFVALFYDVRRWTYKMFDTCATHYCHVLVEDKYYLFNDYIDIIDIDYIVCLYIYIYISLL